MAITAVLDRTDGATFVDSPKDPPAYRWRIHQPHYELQTAVSVSYLSGFYQYIFCVLQSAMRNIISPFECA